MNVPPPTARQARLFWTATSALAIGVICGLLFLLVWGLSRVLTVLSPVLWPLAVAGVVAYLLDPVVDYFHRKGLSRPRAIVSVFALALVIVAAVFANIVPPIVSQTREFAARIPNIQTNVQQRVETWLNNPPDWFKLITPGAKPGAPPAASTTNAVSDLGETNAPTPLANENTP
ncbi:MAG TPA: AI-2E family transporter, partial [Verrucomicrobiae bacterium]